MIKNVMAQWGRTIFAIVVGFLVPPLMLAFLGESLYGTWQSLVAWSGTFQLLALGIPMASVRFLSKALGEKDDDGIRNIVGTCTGLYLIIGAVVLGLGLAMVPLFDSIYGDDIDNQAMRGPAMWASAILAVNAAAGFVLRLPYSVMAGHRHFVPQNFMMMATLFFKTSFVVGVLVSTGSLIGLALAEIAVLTADFLLSWRYVKKHFPTVSFSLSHFRGERVREILSFGGFVLFLHMGMKLSFQIDALVIGGLIGHKEVAYYGGSNTVVIYWIEIMIAMAAVVMPSAAKLDAEGNSEELTKILLRWTKVAYSIALLVGGFLLVAGPAFVVTWMRAETFREPTKAVMPVLVFSSLLFLPVRAVAMPLLFGLGRVKVPALAFFVCGLANLGISLALARPYGLFGVGLGTAVPNGLFALFLLVYALRSLGVSPTSFLRYVGLKATLAALLPIAALGLANEMKPLNGIVDILIAGTVYVVVFAALWWFWVYRQDELVDREPLAQRIRSRFGR